MGRVEYIRAQIWIATTLLLLLLLSMGSLLLRLTGTTTSITTSVVAVVAVITLIISLPAGIVVTATTINKYYLWAIQLPLVLLLPPVLHRHPQIVLWVETNYWRIIQLIIALILLLHSINLSIIIMQNKLFNNYTHNNHNLTLLTESLENNSNNNINSSNSHLSLIQEWLSTQQPYKLIDQTMFLAITIQTHNYQS